MEDVLKAALDEMVTGQCGEVEKLAKVWGEKRSRGEGGDFAEVEIGVREWALRVGLAVMERLVQEIGANVSPSPSRCATCERTMRSEGTKSARMHTSMGSLKYERSYVRCRECGKGAFPQDVEFGLDEQRNSPALQRIVSLVGAVAPFEKASDLLGEIGSIPMAGSKVERITEQIGTRVQEWEKGRQQKAMAGLDVGSNPAVDRLYVEADGTTVPMRVEGARDKNQRTKGKVEYKEVKVGAVFDATVDESGQAQGGEKTYTGTFEDAAACVRQVVSEAKARGSDKAKEIVLLNDGGEWLWNRLPTEFPGRKVTQILDWCHPSERLGEISAWTFGNGTVAAKRWAEHQRDLLYAGKVGDVIPAIARLKPSGKEGQEFVRQSLGYFRDHAHRMNYAELRAKGYFIGSGVIESACKHIVNHRFKQAGMKWSRLHVPKILALRVARASGWWNQFWQAQLVRAA